MPDKFTKITAPYNFVPLSGWVFQPDWASQVSHDLPFAEGLSGSLEIEITAETPILVGGQQTKATDKSPGEVKFFQLPDNRYAIPGTSLKGMTRSVLEIASFGKMQFVDDRRLSIRDISGREVIGDNYQISGQKAGFLHLRDDSEVEIIPCDFVHISHRDMERWLNVNTYIFTKRDTFTVKEKYQRWSRLTHQTLAEDGALPTIQFNVNTASTPKMAHDLGQGRKTGELVFTGQISDKGQNRNGKYRDFVFFDRKMDKPLTVSPKVFKDFLYIHGDEDKNATGSSWRAYWRDIFFKKDCHEIPVFYHLDEHEQVRSIGLAYMYRLAYHYSIGETIDYTNEKHRNPDGYDLADLLFGKVHPDDNKSQQSLKSRVNFGVATLVGTPQLARYSEATILNGPKPTYFPNYVRQTDVEQVIDQKSPYKLHNGKQYRTYMQPNSEIRGWKRYPVKRWQEVHLQALKGKQLDNKKVQVKLYPLQKGSRFKSTLRFHNLLPTELGALIWTLTWGSDKRLRHNLGMGKSFGFGQLSIKIIGSDIRQAPEQTIAFDEKHYISLFRKLMEAEYAKAKQSNAQGKWGDSEQIRQLKAMAYPEHPQATSDNLKHMALEEQLEDGKKRNQFVKAKQNGWVLHEYSRYGRDSIFFPRNPRKPRQKPKPPADEHVSEQQIPTEIDRTQQWIETTIQKLYEEKRIPVNQTDPICCKPLAEKWQRIEDAAFKQKVREEISRRWTNAVEDENVDWWQVPPSAAMRRVKKIYEQG
jgi:CRISPR-associated protein (TIGR03986 family)